MTTTFIPLSFFLAGRQLQPESAERAERQVRHPDAPLALAAAAEARGAARVPAARDQEGAQNQGGKEIDIYNSTLHIAILVFDST